jgi:FAD dependent oxidoreductase TIGR03364
LSEQQFDDAVVGAGILGLAHAYQLARRGRRVVVFERGARAQGASVRNFGMLWPIGQPAGRLHDLARRSLEIWTEVLRASNLWHERTGSLHAACHDDEAEVLREFVAGAREERGCELLDPLQATARCPALVREGLRLAMWSPTEVCVDPREVVAGLPEWLTRTFGVRFVFSTAVLGYDRPLVKTAYDDWRADRLMICTGDAFEGLFPASFTGAGLTRCKLQMMRTPAMGGAWRLGPMLAAG